MKTFSLSKRVLLSCLFLFYCGVVATRADIVDAWHWRNPHPFADNMRSVCFAGGKFVAVGEGGVIHSSSDGVSWDDGQRPVLPTLNRVIYANGQFIAVGFSGAIVTSPDAVTWTARTSGATDNLLAATYGNGRYVATGDGSQMVISTNGVDWTVVSPTGGGASWIAFGNGVFVTGNTGMTVRVSIDGQNWTTAGLPSAGGNYPHIAHRAEFGNGIFVAIVSDETGGKFSSPAPYYYQSADGTNWLRESIISLGPSYGGGDLFYTFLNGLFQEGTSVISRTVDGTSQTFGAFPTNSLYQFRSLAYGNGQYVLIADAGNCWTSIDETNWTTTFSGFRPYMDPVVFNQIIQGASNIVAFGSALPVLISSDGLNFTAASNSPSGVLTAGAYDGTNFVAVGSTFTISGPLNRIYVGEVYTSTNSTDWVQRTSNANQPLNAICRGPSRWVAVGGAGTVITSPNTLSWTLRTSGTASGLNGVAFGNGTYVAVGNGGTVITSPDGTTWDVQFSGTTTNLNALQFLNGQFFAAGDGGTILTSTDGVTWSSQNSGTATGLTGITYGYSGYLACGSDTLLLSTNGVSWQNITTKVPSAVSLQTVAFLDHSYWLGGNMGLLLRSDSADGVPHLAGKMLPGNGGFQLKVSMTPAAPYRVQFCTNVFLDSWHDLVTCTNPVSPDTWIHSNACQMPSGYYRVVSP